jgi:hypothetical protein
MRNQNIDLEVADLFPIEGDAHLLPEEGEDAFHNFFTDWQNGIDGEALHKQTAHLDAVLKVAAKASATPEQKEPAADDELAKAYLSASGRRKANLREYLKTSLAGGETLEAIVAHARRYDAETANLLQEIGNELG